MRKIGLPDASGTDGAPASRGAKRRLCFGSDEDELDEATLQKRGKDNVAFAQHQLDMLESEDGQRYNFDFACGQPLAADPSQRYLWYAASPDELTTPADNAEMDPRRAGAAPASSSTGKLQSRFNCKREARSCVASPRASHRTFLSDS